MLYQANLIKYLDRHPCRALSLHAHTRKTEKTALSNYFYLIKAHGSLIALINIKLSSESRHTSPLQAGTAHLSHV